MKKIVAVVSKPHLGVSSSDIAYQDKDVCILSPDSAKGVIIYSCYPLDKGVDIWKVGLKTGMQLSGEGIEFGKTICNAPT